MEGEVIRTNNRFIPGRGSVFAMQKFILSENPYLRPAEKQRLNELAWYASTEQEFVNRLAYALPNVYKKLIVTEMS